MAMYCTCMYILRTDRNNSSRPHILKQSHKSHTLSFIPRLWSLHYIIHIYWVWIRIHLLRATASRQPCEEKELIYPPMCTKTLTKGGLSGDAACTHLKKPSVQRAPRRNFTWTKSWSSPGLAIDWDSSNPALVSCPWLNIWLSTFSF